MENKLYLQIRKLNSELIVSEEKQRKKIAGELHDEIGHSLALMQIKLELLKQKINDDDIRNDVNILLFENRENIRKIRHIISELTSTALHEYGLIAGIKSLIIKLRNDFKNSIKFETDISYIDMDYDLSILVYRSISELLMNAIRHSNGTIVELSINYLDERLNIKVSDNGIGFSLSENNNQCILQESFGLYNVRDRITTMNGSFQIKSQLGKGTEVELSIPLSKDQNII